MAADEKAKAELRAAFDEMMAALARARDAIDDPALHGAARERAQPGRGLPLPDEPGLRRDRARLLRRPALPLRAARGAGDREGHHRQRRRHLLLDADRRQPALLDPRAARPTRRHWRGEPRAASGPARAAVPDLRVRERLHRRLGQPARARARHARDDGPARRVEARRSQPTGASRSCCAPEKPAGFAGNFLRTRVERQGRTLRRRLRLGPPALLRLGARGPGRVLDHARGRRERDAPPAYDPAAAAAALRRTGEIARGQVHFWNEFYDVLLETYGDRNGDGKSFMPRNAFNAPNAASGATGGGMNTNIYAGGVYELAPDEALVIESRMPGRRRCTSACTSRTSGASRSTTRTASRASTASSPSATPTARSAR